MLPNEEDQTSSEIKTDDEIMAMLDRMEKLELEAEAKSREVEAQGLFMDPILKIHKVPAKKHEKKSNEMTCFVKSTHHSLVVLNRCCKRTKSC